MRGKNILLISMIAMLFGTMATALVVAPPPPAKLFIDPPSIKDQPPTEFYISIEVSKVQDLWAAGFTVKYAPYVSVLVASDINEGDFLEQGGYNTYFVKNINAFKGEVKIGVTRLVTSGLPIEGISGEGTLATMKFTVIEAGDSPIELVNDYLVDSNGNPINHNTQDLERRFLIVSFRRMNIPSFQF